MDDLTYPMNEGIRGLCLIFTQSFKSSNRFDERKHAQKDLENLSECFLKLNFIVEPHSDKSADETEEILKGVAKLDHSKYSCFICCFSTHGDSGVLEARDKEIEVEKIFANFTVEENSTLAKKPKIFFIQACQGTDADEGVTVLYTGNDDVIKTSRNCEESTITEDRKESKILMNLEKFKIQYHADFLIAFSSSPGCYSFASKESWFMKALCDVLSKHAKEKDLLQMLTIVNRTVADRESRTNDIRTHKKKQIPYVLTTLTKDLKFFVS